MNILLDKLPEDYKGYLIRTDFRIGIQISMCLSDNELNDYYKVGLSLSLLFGNGIPQDFNVALDGLKWFLQCGNEEEQEQQQDEEDKETVFDFEIDNYRLYSSFMKTYGIDLNTASLHWFKFVRLIGDLGDCAFSQVVGIRSTNISDMKGKERQAYSKLKKKYEIKTSYNDKEKDLINDFMSKVGG